MADPRRLDLIKAAVLAGVSPLFARMTGQRRFDTNTHGALEAKVSPVFVSFPDQRGFARIARRGGARYGTPPVVGFEQQKAIRDPA